MISRIDSLSVNELLTQPVIVSPTEHIHKAIGLMRRTKSYELFVMEQDEDGEMRVTGTKLKAEGEIPHEPLTLETRPRTVGGLLKVAQVAEGSLTQCPVSPRDALRPAVREGAHGIVFVHNHPSGDPAPSAEDADLTERLRAAADIVGVLARDHVIVAAGGYDSFVEAGRWRRLATGWSFTSSRTSSTHASSARRSARAPGSCCWP